MGAETKLCYKCQRFKSLASFNNDKNRPDGKYPYCRACRGKYIKNSHKTVHITEDYSKLCHWCEAPIGGTHANRKYCSSSCTGRKRLAESYGLSVEEYKELLASMGGQCPICHRVVKRWNIDHNHETGESYGPVCTTCNTKLLAWAFHDVGVAERLAEFLRNPPIRARYGPRFVNARKVKRANWHKAKYQEGLEEGEYPKVLHGRYRGKRSRTRRAA